MKTSFLAPLFALSLALPSSAAVSIAITEYMYNGSEFIEFTNISDASIDMTGWSFSDSARVSGSVDLSAFGIVAAGQSVILSEVSAEDFRTVWGLGGDVLVIGGNSQNLGRSDEINLYDSFGTLVDRLTYGDEDFPGTIRTDGNASRPGSGVTDPANYGANDITRWNYSTLDDGLSFNSATGGYIGSPGVAAVPEASSLLFGLTGTLGLLRRRR